MSDQRPERKGLGRGLSALMADIGLDARDPLSTGTPAAERPAGLRQVPLHLIVANADQPRRHFDEAALDELAQSIKERGVVQPIVVRPIPESAQFEIVAGERRWRAAQRAGLTDIPAVVRTLDDQQVLEIAIVENIQREGLNPIEESRGYRQLIDKFGHTQEMIATALGKSRSHIANLLRLLNLPDPVQDMVMSGQLSAGHARALVTAADPMSLARKIVAQGLSVRQAESLARQAADDQGGGSTPRGRPAAFVKDADTRALEEDLSAGLGMSVSIAHKTSGDGSVTISYQNLEQLDALCQILSTVR